MESGTELELFVNGMTCSHCERELIGSLNQVDGVVGASVERETGRVLLSIGGAVNRDDISITVSDAGFDLVSWSCGS